MEYIHAGWEYGSEFYGHRLIKIYWNCNKKPNVYIHCVVHATLRQMLVFTYKCDLTRKKN